MRDMTEDYGASHNFMAKGRKKLWGEMPHPPDPIHEMEKIEPFIDPTVNDPNWQPIPKERSSRIPTIEPHHVVKKIGNYSPVDTNKKKESSYYKNTPPVHKRLPSYLRNYKQRIEKNGGKEQEIKRCTLHTYLRCQRGGDQQYHKEVCNVCVWYRTKRRSENE